MGLYMNKLIIVLLIISIWWYYTQCQSSLTPNKTQNIKSMISDIVNVCKRTTLLKTANDLQKLNNVDRFGLLSSKFIKPDGSINKNIVDKIINNDDYIRKLYIARTADLIAELNGLMNIPRSEFKSDIDAMKLNTLSSNLFVFYITLNIYLLEKRPIPTTPLYTGAQQLSTSETPPTFEQIPPQMVGYQQLSTSETYIPRLYTGLEEQILNQMGPKDPGPQMYPRDQGYQQIPNQMGLGSS